MGYTEAYDGQFYAARRERTLPSARRILGIVREYAPFRSVADFGCGTGTWLSVALEEFGAKRAVGFEGEWMRPELLDDSRIEFHPHDLEQSADPGPVDLAISLEVAEGLLHGLGIAGGAARQGHRDQEEDRQRTHGGRRPSKVDKHCRRPWRRSGATAGVAGGPGRP